MTLNTFFLGDNTVVDITTKDTLDEIKLKLASNFSQNKGDLIIRVLDAYGDFSPGYVYSLKKNRLGIYFAKDLNRKTTNSLSLPYPSFTGEIINNGDHRLIKGEIGRPETTYYSGLFVLAIFAFVCYIRLTQGEVYGINVPLFLSFFSFGIFIVGLFRTRSKIKEMADEIDRVFSNVR